MRYTVLLLQGEGEVGVGTRGAGPDPVVETCKPQVVEAEAYRLERSHHLHSAGGEFRLVNRFVGHPPEMLERLLTSDGTHELVERPELR